MLTAFACWINANSSEAFGTTFGFDIHHRYSDTVKQFLNLDGLPEKGTVDYYTVMAHRDQLLNGRRLAASTKPVLTFYSFVGNQTYYISNLAYLHYSFLSVGTPSLEFFVALDTGSDLFWLPCDCTTCARNFYRISGKKMELEIYSPSNSTTSKPLPCNSPKCGPTRGCSTMYNACSYEISYGATSSTGILVDDVLHLGTNVTPQDIVDVPVTFGCGQNLTGNFLDVAGINGVFGLGMDSISVPSVLANKGLVANSFSLCFGSGSIGRIEFGDKGSPLQKKTPFNLQQSKPTYNITVTQIAVDNNVTDLVFAANFDSAVSYSYFTDPAYSFIVNNFNSRITEKPYHFPGETRLNYCYDLGENEEYVIPNLTLKMKGGSHFNVTAPTIAFRRADGKNAYCLGIIKTKINNVIGHNFMEGYRLVFDREDMVLGWKESDCFDAISSKTLAPNNGNSSRSRPPPPPPPSGAARSSSMTSGVVAVILAIFFHHFIILSS
ncbi:hypothetical protein ACP275_14G194400 [Erythranthe tilingii]